jgi:hypothetical protein
VVIACVLCGWSKAYRPERMIDAHEVRRLANLYRN